MTLGSSMNDSESRAASQTDKDDSNMSTSAIDDFSPFKSGKFTKNNHQKSRTAKLGEKIIPPAYLKSIFVNIQKDLIVYFNRQTMYEFENSNILINYNEDGTLTKHNQAKQKKETHDEASADNKIKLENAPVNPSISFPKHLNQITSTYNLHPFIKFFQSLETSSAPPLMHTTSKTTTVTPQSSEIPMHVIANYFSNNNKNCDSFFSIFLYKLSAISNSIVYSLIASVFRGLRDCLNDFGYEILELFSAQNEGLVKIEFERGGEDNENERGSFCEVEGPQFIAVVYDFFLKEFYEKWLNSGLDKKKSKLQNEFLIEFSNLGGTRDDTVNIEIISKVLHWFNTWLLDVGFSKINLNFDGFDMPLK